MKKVLLCAGILALAVSCTESEYDLAPVQNSKGITFTTVADNPSTRGEMWVYEDGKQMPFWYAEQDMITIVAKDVKKVDNLKTAWDDSAIAVYKATKSKADGEFTASTPSELLNFNNDGTGSFIVVSPQSTPDATSTTVKFNSPTKSDQSQKGPNGQGVSDNMFQIALSTGAKTNAYDAVGETVKMNMLRKNAVVMFNTKDVDAYAEDFGGLMEVKMESNLVLVNENATYTVTPKGVDEFASSEVKFEPSTTPGDKKKEITLTLNDGSGSVEWTDKGFAYMITDPVKRVGKEDLKIKYTFERISFDFLQPSSKSWEAGTSFYGPITLDISSYPYLVTNHSDAPTNLANDRTLIINNEGAFADGLTDNGLAIHWPILDKTHADYNDPTNLVALTEFNTIKVKPVLDIVELGKLKDLTNLVSVTLLANDAIPAETFKGLLLKKINMPLVTYIDQDAFDANQPLTHVLLPKYTFSTSEGSAVRDILITNTAAKTTLSVLDISSVPVLGAVFPAAGFSLQGYTGLTKVTLMDGVRLGSNVFAGCTNLDELTGGPVEVNGTGVFSGCTSLGRTARGELTIYTKKGTDASGNATTSTGLVPSSSFKNCSSLVKLIDAETGDTLAPITVGESAFADATNFKGIDLSAATKIEKSAFARTAIETVDLSKVSTFGEYAFQGCASMKGDNLYKGKKILTINATEIPKGLFEDCISLVFVYFAKATKIGNDILRLTTSSRELEEVKFGVKFAHAEDTPSERTFGASSNVSGGFDVLKLYVVSGQTLKTANSIELGKTGSTATFTFSEINIED